MAEAPPAILREVWLVVDGSGSMSGLPTEQARDAALFFVKDLPHGQGAQGTPCNLTLTSRWRHQTPF